MKIMKFRPCIDIHNGKVKQIVGGSLSDRDDQAQENFVSSRDAAWYAKFYLEQGLSGGHVILLNPVTSPYYEQTKAQAVAALSAAPGLLQAGGGIRPGNAGIFLDAGASHVIVTSYVFRDGRMDRERLDEMVRAVGRERLVLDLSCRKKTDGRYYIVTDRWQVFTDAQLTPELLDELSASCSEFLVHAVDTEGKQAGPDRDLIRLLGTWAGIPVTYAGGISSPEDLELLREEGRERVDFTVGSALDLFGGKLPFDLVKRAGSALPADR